MNEEINEYAGPEDEEYESDSKLRISAIDLAIKAVSVSGNLMVEPEQVLKIAKDYYAFIISGDE